MVYGDVQLMVRVWLERRILTIVAIHDPTIGLSLGSALPVL